MLHRKARRSVSLLALLPVLGLVLGGCGEDQPPGPLAMDEAQGERWEIALVEWRIEKNEDFMDPQRSPLPEAMRDGFEGLDYYFPEPAFRYRLPLLAAVGPDAVDLAKPGGEAVSYEVKGRLRFRHADRVCDLTVLGAAEDSDRLWVPFYDLTNGEATHPQGRYLDLEPAGDGMFEVDFNKAYNPFCAYDPERWKCVLPPEGNRLPLRVEAGEKLLDGPGR